MNKDNLTGKAKDMAGRAERQVGEWTGDKESQGDGIGKQAEGKVQKAWGDLKDAGRKVPKSMRWALIWGGISSLVLTAALLLAMPKANPLKATFDGGGVPFILGQLSSGMQDFLLLMIIFVTSALPDVGPSLAKVIQAHL